MPPFQRVLILYNFPYKYDQNAQESSIVKISKLEITFEIRKSSSLHVLLEDGILNFISFNFCKTLSRLCHTQKKIEKHPMKIPQLAAKQLFYYK